MTGSRWLVVVVQTLLLSWALLYLATYFDVPFVREAAGDDFSTWMSPCAATAEVTDSQSACAKI